MKKTWVNTTWLRRTLRLGTLFGVLLAYGLTGGTGLTGLTSPALADPGNTTSATWSQDPGQTTFPTVRLDTNGEAIDAHSSSIVPVQVTRNGVTTTTYYMYGEAYGCGWSYTYSTATQRPYCGVNVYSSPDLQHWTKIGPAISDLNAVVAPGLGSWEYLCAKGCFRPKVVYNAATQKYVMWLNVAGSSPTASSYVVLTSSQPSSGFTYAATPQLAGWMENGDANGDENLFVDTDGTAWVVYTRMQPNSDHWLVVERLNSAYTNAETQPGLAFHSALPYMTGMAEYPNNGTEAPTLFKRGSTYYLMFGPTCPYCAGTPTYYASSTVLTGNWGPVTQLNPTSCGGQPDMVLPVAAPPPAQPTYVYVSDQWQGGSTVDHNVLGSLNQALAQEYTGTLTFDSSGNIQPFSCRPSVSLPSLLGTVGSDQALPSGWQGIDTSHGIQTSCAITSTRRVAQTFVPTHAGTLSQIWVLAYQRYQGGTDAPNQPLYVTVSNAAAPQQQLAQVTVPQQSVSWSPSWVKVSGLNIPVTQQDVDSGRVLQVTLSSPTTTGCFGVGETNVAGTQAIDAYPSGAASVETGTVWSSRPFSDIDFRSNL